ncbi:helix-turn-helix transcriptional regulator [Burkholderia ambifaria]|uniref:helix-turn-helix transcriptional regulator n=1 Tax=Burkholderia ambifaria TaxID=152480 RepID=UPI001FC85EC0|nr:transcriptional regulator [Burkholderia ambifaria]
MKKSAAPADSGKSIEPILPRVGLSTLRQFLPFSPIGRETIRKLCIAGKFPPPIRMSKTCTFYRNEELHRWLADPLGYTAPSQESREAA